MAIIPAFGNSIRFAKPDITKPFWSVMSPTGEISFTVSLTSFISVPFTTIEPSISDTRNGRETFAA